MITSINMKMDQFTLQSPPPYKKTVTIRAVINIKRCVCYRGMTFSP